MTIDDLPVLAHWLGQEHVARWWMEPGTLEYVEREYGPHVDGRDPRTQIFVLEVDEQPAGMFQRYRSEAYPEWARAVPGQELDGIGIDYLIGDVELVGRGVGSRAIARFTAETFLAFPDVARVMAAPQQGNTASWRALEKAGFDRVWSGQLDSNDPSDAGPAYLYVRKA